MNNSTSSVEGEEQDHEVTSITTNNNNNNSRPMINWNLVSTSNPPSPRFDNTLVYYKGSFYLFGGSDGNTTPQSGYSPFLKLDLNDFSWQSQNCNNRTRVLHTAVVHNDSMYIFGGGVYEDERTGIFSTQKVFKSINEMLRYSFEDKEWSLVEPVIQNNTNTNNNNNNENIPEQRDGHCSVVVGDEMFVIGGSKTTTSTNSKVPITSTFFAHADVYNFTSRSWKRINSPRFGRLCSAVHYHHFDGTDYIYVFGGYDSSNKGVKDLWRLDLSSQTWKLLNIITTNEINAISERYGHSANVYQDKMYIYGGYSRKGFQRDFFSFDFIKEEWEKIEFSNGPPKRRRHNAILVSDTPSGRTKLYLYGGTYLSCLYNDLWEYSFPSDVYIPSDNLANDFALLFENPEEFFSDITFLVEDKLIHSHKNILSVRSPYFKGLFKSGLKESFERVIKVQEKYEDFKCLIEFLYTGNENLVQLENCIGLLYLSDLYHVPRLKTICESKATEGIDNDSVIEIFKQADFYKLDKLRKICLSYIARNNKELTDQIKTLDSSILLEIIQYLEPSK